MPQHNGRTAETWYLAEALTGMLISSSLAEESHWAVSQLLAQIRSDELTSPWREVWEAVETYWTETGRPPTGGVLLERASAKYLHAAHWIAEALAKAPVVLESTIAAHVAEWRRVQYVMRLQLELASMATLAATEATTVGLVEALRERMMTLALTAEDGSRLESSRKLLSGVETLPRTDQRIKTGWYDLDRMCPTLLDPATVTVVAAGTSVGKSTFARELAVHVARYQGQPVLFVALEETPQLVALKLLWRLAKVPMREHLTGEKSGLTLAESQKLAEAREILSMLPLSWYCGEARSPADIAALIHQAAAHPEPPRVVILDHLHEMEWPSIRQKGVVLAIGEGMSILRRAARQANVALVATAQLARENRKKKQEPGVCDIKFSGEIENKADHVLLLHAPQWNLESNTRRVIIAKNRHGPCGTMDLTFLREIGALESMAHGCGES